MKNIKKISALILALILVLALSASSLAATALDGGIEGDTDDAASVQDNTITIMKELKVYNTTGGNIYLPTVGYTYTITGEAVAEGTTVTDSGDHVGYVYTGLTSALDATTKTVSFSSATTSGYGNNGTATAVTITQPTLAATDGTSYYGGFQIAVTPNTFTHSGIYRYKIVEAEDSTNTLAKAGVVHQDSTYESVRYLDIYVRQAVDADVTAHNASAVGDRVVYGYVLWCPEEKNSAQQTEDSNITKTPNVSKTNGWVGATGGDEYNTWNLVVTKDIVGNWAEVGHQFPFQVVFTSQNATAATIHYTATNGIPTTATTATLSSAATTTIGTLTDASTLKLGDDGSVTFYGIPAGVTATVQENNDTFDVYTAGATITAATSQTYTDNQVQAGASATIISGLDNATTTTAVGSANTTAAWTNTLAVVSPTGVVLRVAPFACIFFAGMFLLLVSRRRREEAEEA